MNRYAVRYTIERCRLRAAHRARPAAGTLLLALSVMTATAAAQTTPPALSSPTPGGSAVTSAAGTDASAVAARYAPETRWGIFRKGKRIGTHTVRFQSEGTELRVEVESRIRVTVLRLPVFRFDYRASERWQGSELISVDVTLQENSERTELALRSTASGSELLGAQGRTSVPRLMFASNHWHAGVLGSRRFYNTLTGEASRIDIVPVGTGELVASDAVGALPYTRYRYTGGVSLEAWYDEAQRWVGLAFRGEDGSRIEYRLDPQFR